MARVAHTCGVCAPKPAAEEPRTPGVGLTPPPHPAQAARAQRKGGTPCRKAPQVITPLRGRVCGGPAPHRPDPVAFCNLQRPGTREKQKSGAFQTAGRSHPARRGGKGSPAGAAELRAPQAQGLGGCGPPLGFAKTPGQELGGATG